MRESGEPMEFEIFDFSRCFQGLYVRGGMGLLGLRMDAGGFRPVRATSLGKAGHPCTFGVGFATKVINCQANSEFHFCTP